MSTKKILIVGGKSRAAQAFRCLAAMQPDVALTTLVRQSCRSIGSERIAETGNYFDPPDALLAEADIVINFAGITHGHDAVLLEAVNAIGPTHLAKKAKAKGTKLFIHLSSFKVYGNAQEVTRMTREEPDTVYGRSKLAADIALRALQGDSFTVIILRLPMLYGGGAGDNLRRIGTLMLMAGLFPVPRQVVRRSVLHVKNLAAILMTLVSAPVRGICIAADTEPFTYAVLAQALGEATGRTPRLIKLPNIVFAPFRFAFPGLYNKIFESKFAPPAECFADGEILPISLYDGLVQMFSCNQAQT